jgi:SWI/SNF-related matrix-associated actin-dependent regulator of chromatin subfamily A-like protein 1
VVKLNRVLKPYQQFGVSEIERRLGRILIADDMGLGKTFQVLSWLATTELADARPAVVLCPAYLKWVWVRECESVGLRVVAIEGRKAPKQGYPTEFDVVVINYDILADHLEWVRDNTRTVILDECQYVKNPTAKRSRATYRLGRGMSHILPMSGTPLTNRPSELFPVLNLLWPAVFPSWRAYAFLYCDPKKKPWGWEYKGATRLPELHAKLVECGMLRRLKRDVLKDLPPLVREVVPVRMTKTAEYKMAERSYIQWLQTFSPAAAKRASLAGEALSKSTGLKRLAARLSWPDKLAWISDFLENNPGEKLAVYCKHIAGLKAIQASFPDCSVTVHGKVRGADRETAVTRFQTDPSIRLFIGQVDAAGTGLTLTAAKALAFLEMDFVPATHTQVEARIHRLGQEGQAVIYYLVAANSVEEDLCEVLEIKQQVLSDVLDGGEGETLGVLELLNTKLRKRLAVHA